MYVRARVRFCARVSVRTFLCARVRNYLCARCACVRSLSTRACVSVRVPHRPAHTKPHQPNTQEIVQRTQTHTDTRTHSCLTRLPLSRLSVCVVGCLLLCAISFARAIYVFRIFLMVSHCVIQGRECASGGEGERVRGGPQTDTKHETAHRPTRTKLCQPNTQKTLCYI